MHEFSYEHGRTQRLGRLEKRYPEGAKILIEALIVGVGVCDPYPTEYILCRGSRQDFIVFPEEVRDLQQIIESYKQAQQRLDEATADMKKVRDELEEVKSEYEYHHKLK